MNFAPYTPSPDESKRGRSGYQPIPSSSSSSGPSGIAGSYQNPSTHAGLLEEGEAANTVRVNKYETSLPIRVDIEAALTYSLGCVTGVLFLILEQKNDYVRFHAWQSSLLFLGMLVIQFIFMFISTFLSWLLFFTEIFLIGYLSYRAYQDGATLERYEIPYIGQYAAQWTDEE
ncbi:uncharacterized protein VTP21DRAFT_9526 [Calcarisporiella thermophila]|uniref:uncharacterized protein n=1 Tax=Calcarisporiella thermophila TaxID=911321 RepID=UPI0037428CF2